MVPNCTHTRYSIYMLYPLGRDVTSSLVAMETFVIYILDDSPPECTHTLVRGKTLDIDLSREGYKVEVSVISSSRDIYI